MTETYETIVLAVADGVATLTLNRPDRLNSFTAQMHGEVKAALASVAAGAADRTVRCLVLTGAGRGFCAGQDLADRKVAPGTAPVDLGEVIDTMWNALVRSLNRLPVPVLAAVNGVAAGAGANVALACDLVYAARSASFIQSFAKIGLVPDSGGTWSLPRRVGLQRAMGLALLGDKLPAEQAAAWGLIWQCVDDADLMNVVGQAARQLAAGPTRGLARTKEALYLSGLLSFDQSLDLERDFQRDLGASDDYREGVASFLEKRAPRYTGR